VDNFGVGLLIVLTPGRPTHRGTMPSNHGICGLPLLLLAGLAAAPIAGQEGTDTLGVFFVGNSYIYFNNLPGLVEGISQGLDGPYVSTASHTHGGYTLREHLTDGHLPAAFETEGSDNQAWDAVVLQEQSALATVTDTVTGELGNPDEFQSAARALATLVHETGATPVLYMTWAKKRWPDQLTDISEAYLKVGAELGAPVAAVGVAWAASASRRPDLDLFLADGSHPTPAGSYLAACVMYSTLTGRSPVGAPREVWGAPWNGGGPIESALPTLLVSLSPRDAAFLQDVAWTIASQRDGG
jgi:hypothetical protein